MLTKKRVIKIVIENAPKNLKLSSPSIKRDIIKVVALKLLKQLLMTLKMNCFLFLLMNLGIYIIRSK